MRIVSGPEDVCLEHATQFWNGLLTRAQDQSGCLTHEATAIACPECAELTAAYIRSLAASISESNPNTVRRHVDAVTPAEFDFAKYKDLYTAKLTELIETKVAGKEIVAAPAQEHPQVINLMDALKQSVAKLRPGQEAPPAAATAPAQELPPTPTAEAPIMAPSKKTRSSPQRKKKSS